MSGSDPIVMLRLWYQASNPMVSLVSHVRNPSCRKFWGAHPAVLGEKEGSEDPSSDVC